MLCEFKVEDNVIFKKIYRQSKNHIIACGIVIKIESNQTLLVKIIKFIKDFEPYFEIEKMMWFGTFNEENYEIYKYSKEIEQKLLLDEF